MKFLINCLHLLQAEGDSQGSGGTSEPGGEVKPGPKDEPKTGDEKTKKVVDEPVPDPKDQPMTPAVFKGVLDHQGRQIRTDFEKQLKKNEKAFNERMQRLEELLSAEKKKPAGKSDETPPEVVELKRELAESREELDKLAKRLTDSKERDKQYRFETQVKDALVRAGCLKSELAFRVLASDLTHDEENDRIYASVEGEYGREEMNLDDFIKHKAKEEIVPEFFTASLKSGSAAAGDAGEGSGQYKFTFDQLKDPAFYEANKEEIRKAIDKGLVKGIARPES